MIASLRMMNFRCFDTCSVELDPAGGIFIGKNAQGKTSLLEAACLLLRLQSPRARRMSQIQKTGTEGFGIAADVRERELQLRYENKALDLRVDGESILTRRDYLIRSGLVVWMGNEDLDLVRGGGNSRRRYLDFLAAQVDAEYRHHWTRYRKALKSRNALLKNFTADSPEVRAYTQLLIDHGSEIIAKRQNLCQDLLPRVLANHATICGKAEEIHIDYRDKSKGDLEAAFEKITENETRRGVTLAGPHRDDLILTLGDKPARDYGSEGQQRTLALALKLAQGEILRVRGKMNPLYLIDDIFGELDADRRNALMHLLPRDAQKLITTTQLDWYQTDQLPLPQFQVHAGTITPT